MNTVEINKIACQAEDIERMAFESAMQQAATPQPGVKPRRVAGVRYALLAVIALLLGALGLYVQNSINEIDSEIQQIYATLVTEGSLGPD